MATHIALLRGINVGGRNKVAMAGLREAVSSLGHTGVTTYIQSGNVVFTARDAAGGAPGSGGGDVGSGEAGAGRRGGGEAGGVRGGGVRGGGTEAMATELADVIEGACGVRVGVIVLSRAELAQAVRDNPYPGEANPKHVHAVFLPQPPGPQTAAGVAAACQRAADSGGRDSAQFAGRTLFLHTPDGFGRSKLAELLLARRGSPVPGATARNWATVTKLLALCDA